MGGLSWYSISIISLCLRAIAAEVGWTVSTLQCEYLSSPAMGIETSRPRLTWINEPPQSAGASWALGSEETHFQVQVVDVTVGGQKKQVWDTGKLQTSTRRGPLIYNQDNKAVPLQSARVYEWKVRTWIQGAGNQTAATAWSHPARFVVGLLDPNDDWKGASWIGHPDPSLNFFRRVIALPSATAPPPSVQRALLFVSGLGYHHVEIDGRPVTKAKLEPGYTTFSKVQQATSQTTWLIQDQPETSRAFYSTYDVTDFLDPPSVGHVLTVELGNGYLHGVGGEPTGNRMLIATLKVLLSDGSRWELGTDEAWRVNRGAVGYDSVFNGEVFDGRVASSLRPSLLPDYDDSHWATATPIAGPGGMLRSPHMPPIEVVQELRAVSLTEPRPGVFVFDFAQNTAGVCRLYLPVACLRGRMSAGQNVTLRHAEVLQHAGIVTEPQPGMLYTDNLKSARATDTYILSEQDLQQPGEDAMVVYEPKFTYHGFRYAELTGLPPGVVPTLDWVVSLVQHTAVQATGSQHFDNLVLSGVHRLTLWSQTSNLQSVPTDCPNRDERKGYGGDAQLAAEEAIFNFDMTATFLKFLRDMVFEMDEDGTIPDTTPFQAAFRPADPSWSTALPSIAYYLYRDTGDAGIVQEFYYPILRYMNWLEGQYRMQGMANFTAHFGDWVNVGWPKGRLNGHLTASASFIENCNQVASLARVMGDQQQADRFSSLAVQLRQEWHEAYYNTSIGNYGGGEQTSMALALYLQAVPEELVPKVSSMLVEDIVVTKGGHQSCGIIGTKYMFEVLSAIMKRTDVGLLTAAQTSYPSFGYMLLSPAEPATTLWELWDSDKQGPGMNSRNHIMFGAIDAWFHRHLIGIRPSEDPDKAGFRDVQLSPYLDPCMRDVLAAASGQTRTVRGVVKLGWQWNVNGTYEVRATVPESSVGRLKLEGPEGAGAVTLLAINGVPLPPKKSLHASQSLDLPSGVHTVLADFTPGVSCQDRGLPTIASAAAA